MGGQETDASQSVLAPAIHGPATRWSELKDDIRALDFDTLKSTEAIERRDIIDIARKLTVADIIKHSEGKKSMMPEELVANLVSDDSTIVLMSSGSWPVFLGSASDRSGEP